MENTKEFNILKQYFTSIETKGKSIQNANYNTVMGYAEKWSEAEILEAQRLLARNLKFTRFIEIFSKDDSKLLRFIDPFILTPDERTKFFEKSIHGDLLPPTEEQLKDFYSATEKIRAKLAKQKNTKN